MTRFLVLVLFAPLLHGQTQANTRLTPTQFASLTHVCASTVPTDTLAAIARTESALYPFALSINYPQTAARNAGFANSTMLLARQPATLAEAVGWATWFESHGYTVSIGLMQVNTQTAKLYRVSLQQLFDPCANVRTGAAIITTYYHQSHRSVPSTSEALLNAISAYNTGNTNSGYSNGYVGGVYGNRRANK